MKTKSSRRLVRRLGLALAVAALFVPNAQAIPLDMKSPASSDSAQTRQYADDIRVGPPVRKYADDPAVSPANDHVGYVPINQLAQIQPSAPQQASSTDWGNVSVGAGTLLLVLGLGGLLIAVRHSRRGRLVAA